MNIPFIKYSKVWYTISSLTVLTCLVLLAMWRLNPGIDFTGGSLLEWSFSSNRPAQTEIAPLFQALNLKDTVVQGTGEDQKGFIIRTNFLTEDQHQQVLAAARSKFASQTNVLTEKQFQTIGAAVSSQLRQRALWAVVAVNLGIIIYMAYAFRKVSRPVVSWKYGALAIVALIHDVLLVLGVFAVLGHFWGVEVDIAFVVALLTVLGYSVNDTIVVYDRIREHLLHRRNENFEEIVNSGLNDTLMRSINTTLTVLLPLFALFFLGGETVHNFALALLIGMASGAYSSIFIASPLLVLVEKLQRRQAKA